MKKLAIWSAIWPAFHISLMEMGPSADFLCMIKLDEGRNISQSTQVLHCIGLCHVYRWLPRFWIMPGSLVIASAPSWKTLQSWVWFINRLATLFCTSYSSQVIFKGSPTKIYTAVVHLSLYHVISKASLAWVRLGWTNMLHWHIDNTSSQKFHREVKLYRRKWMWNLT